MNDDVVSSEHPGQTKKIQRAINASMSSCIRCLSSSDNVAPGLLISLLWDRSDGAALISSGGFRAATLSLRVGREGVMGLELLIREVDGSLMLSSGIEIQIACKWYSIVVTLIRLQIGVVGRFSSSHLMRIPFYQIASARSRSDSGASWHEQLDDEVQQQLL